jgi:hypothetical protein
MFQDELTTTDYERELDRRRALGFRPLAVTAYDSKGGTRYAVVWISKRPK